MSRAKELFEYLEDCKRVNILKEEIKVLEADIDTLDEVISTIKSGSTIDSLAGERNKLNKRKLLKQFDLHNLEGRIILFEIAEEFSE